MKVEARLSKLGGQYERANLRRDFTTMVEIEKQIEKIYEETDFWITPYIIRGRNIIRKARGQELLHA